MGILDDLLGSIYWGPGRNGRRLRRIAERGEVLDGVIDAFKVASNGDSGNKYWYGVRLRTAEGESRHAVRQQLLPHSEHARIGTPVIVQRLGRDIVIDWPGTLRRMGIETPSGTVGLAGKTLKEPLPPGIHDERLDLKRLRTGHRTTATLVHAERHEPLGLPSSNWHLELELADGRRLTVKRDFVPAYAQHLLVDGASLDVAVDAKKPDKVQVDWAGMAAAEA